ncbi:ABC transporter permease [Streptomyces sp. NBC_01242]|uniref:ABC transporter permease n=1 Tax=unclassified Streptomyces TaxID=2593676 RepID=UPI002255C999|nr:MULTISPECIES: ABC transporter permease [unclassified Streptomyces]MCX4799851.1 ABC transporter permease [Streptomyces sp. NBC_01242]WSJ41387.1 ABC transporter permease [Streptomyces sp. NBC_01321]WSU26783.1 ABC transporter permease [Streptomyces sp. NBC_01108]
MTTLTSVSPATHVAGPPARFRDLLASEWIKMRSLRSTPWTIGLTGLFVVGSAAVATLADKAAGSGPADFLPFDAYPAAGYWTLMLVASSMGALTVVSEYSSGLIRTTTVAVPARGSVVLAKAAVTAALWTAVGTAASTGSFLVSQAILDGHHAGVPITHPGVFRALVASALLAPICALVGLGLGVLLRHAAGTMVTSVFSLLMLPTMFSESNRWSADIRHALVSAAWNRLVQDWGPQPGSLGYTATVPGSWIVYTLWPLITVALAVLVVRRRDV